MNRVSTPESNPRTAQFLWILLAINTANFFDRQILGAVTEPLRRDWRLGDFEVGLLGTAFTLLYAVAGLPLGRLADTRHRPRLLAAGVFLWSLLTSLSGAAWNFLSLFLMRLGVGIGEATCAPVASSLLGDWVSPRRRARAFSIFMLGLPLGSALSYSLSGIIAQHYGWRVAFWVAGIPGILLALLALRMPEPRAGQAAPEGRMGHAPQFSATRNALHRLLRLPALWWIILSGALHNFNLYAVSAFLPAFLTRYHGLEVGIAGFVVGIVYGLVGGMGMLIGGQLGDWSFSRWKSGRLWVAALSILAAIPLLTAALLAPPGKVWLFAAGMMPASLLLYFYYPTIYASIQDLAEPDLRGTAMAVYFFAMYLMGASFGPAVTGSLSDFLARRAASNAGMAVVDEGFRAVGLHQAMFLIPALCLVLVLVLAAAARTRAQHLSS